jgi:hypothetical protein
MSERKEFIHYSKRSKNMKRYIALLLGVTMVLSASLSARDVSKTGTTAAPFLNIDVGARAVGMGGAFVSIADDISAMYWNPAGVTQLTQSEAVFSHTRWIADVSFNYAAIAIPLGNMGTIGANATFLSMDEMERTTEAYPEGTGETFSAGDYAFGLCYARSLTDRFAIGFNLKYIYQSIYHCTATGMAFDVGTIFTTQLEGLKIGMSISNFGTKMRMNGRDLLTQVDVNPNLSGNNPNINADLRTDEFDLPLMFRVGISMDVLKGIGNSNLILSVDALHPNDDVESLNVGGEYVLNNMFFIRAGYKSLLAKDSEEGLSFGAGMQYNLAGATLKLDYGFKDFGILNEVQMFNLGLAF